MALKQEVLGTGLVTGMTRSLSPATEVYSHNVIDDWPGRQPNEALNLAMNAVADSDYFKTMGMQLVAGRNFTGNFAVDSLDVILNEAAVHRMRLKQPLNQFIRWSLSNAPHRLRIVGVVKDALTNNPFGAAEPTVFVFQPDWTFALTYRLSPEANTRVALSRLAPIFRKYNPDFPFDYHFVDESYAQKFMLEMLIGKLAGIFAVLAIFISCLGLFGLAELRQSFVPRLELRRSVVPSSFSLVPFGPLGYVRSLRVAREYGGAAHEGDRHPKSVGCVDSAGVGFAVGGFYFVGGD